MTAGIIESNVEEVFNNKLVCAACGDGFLCGANAGKCWCFAVKVPADKLMQMRRTFHGCLCQNCLEKVADHE